MQGSRGITLVEPAQEDVVGLYEVTVFALHWDGGGEAASAVAGDEGDGGGGGEAASAVAGDEGDGGGGGEAASAVAGDKGDGWGEAGGDSSLDGDGASLLLPP